MDFKDQIKLLGDQVVKLKDQVNTEEATKMLSSYRLFASWIMIF